MTLQTKLVNRSGLDKTSGQMYLKIIFRCLETLMTVGYLPVPDLFFCHFPVKLPVTTRLPYHGPTYLRGTWFYSVVSQLDPSHKLCLFSPLINAYKNILMLL